MRSKGVSITGIALLAVLAWGMMALAQDTAPATGTSQGNSSANAGPRHGRHGRGMGRMLRGLNLSDSQKQQLKPILEQQHQQMQALRNNSSLTPEQKKAQAQQIRQSTMAQVNGILTPEQQQQLKQRRQAWAGRMAQRLNLSESQKTQMQSIFQQHRAEMQAVQQDSTLTAEQKQAKRQQIRQEMRSQLNGILTPEQQQQWQQMREHRRNHGPQGQGAGPQGL